MRNKLVIAIVGTALAVGGVLLAPSSFAGDTESTPNAKVAAADYWNLGTVKWFNPDKGYGFITYSGGEVFLHFLDLAPGMHWVIGAGTEVLFHVVSDRNGGRATQVQFA